MTSLIKCAIFVSTFFTSCYAQSDCYYNISHHLEGAVKIDVEITPRLLIENNTLRLIANVTWNVNYEGKYANHPLTYLFHGYAVHFLDVETKYLLPSGKKPIHPIDACDSGPKHMWVTTARCVNDNSTSHQCDEEAAKYGLCLCALSDCTGANHPCQSVEDLLGPLYNYHYTILPDASELHYPIVFNKSYEFSISPYAWDFAGFPPTRAELEAVDVCDETVFDSIRELVRGTHCEVMTYRTREDVEIMLLFVPADGIGTTVTQNSTLKANSSSGLPVCGLDPCQTYNLTVIVGIQSYSYMYGTTSNYRVGSVLSQVSSSPPTFIGSSTSYAPVSTSATSVSTKTSSTSTVTPESPIASTSGPASSFATSTASSTDLSTADTSSSFPTTPESFTSTGSFILTFESSTISKSTKTSSSAVTATPTVQQSTTSLTPSKCAEVDIEEFTFPKTQNGLLAYSLQNCPEKSISKASIRCNDPPAFDKTTLVETDCDKTISSLTNASYTDAAELKESLKNLPSFTANVSQLETQNIEDITDFFSAVSSREDELSGTQIREVIETSSHVAEFYQIRATGDDLANKKQDLVRAITNISRKLNTSEPLEIISKNLNIKVEEILNDTNSVSFSANFPGRTIHPMDITVPKEALEKAREYSRSSVKVVSIGFDSSSLFPSKNKSDWVIASSLGDKDIRLNESRVRFTENTLDMDENVSLNCVFWNFMESDWSSDGCKLVSRRPVTCECDHLTNFAVLVSRVKLPESLALDIVSYVGCGLSIVCLFLSIIVICVSRRLRKKYQMQIIGNISFCLFAGLFIFICGVTATEIETHFCSVIAVFLHFFLLAVWSWMAIYSFSVYRDIARVMSSYGQRYKIYYAYAFGYGVPFLIVLINSTITLAAMDKDPYDSSYRSNDYCWLHKNSLYIGFLMPVGVFLLFNIVVFCLVISKLTCRQVKVQSTAKKSKKLKGRLIIGFILAITMGLSWVWGFLLLVSKDPTFLLAMSWLFTIFNTLQGVFIFYVVALRNRELCRTFDDVTELTSSDSKIASTISTGVSPRQSTSKE